MNDHLAELNRILELLGSRSDVIATAITADQEYLVIYDGDDREAIGATISGANVTHTGDSARGDLFEAKYSILGIDTTFLFGSLQWAKDVSDSAEALAMARQGLFEIHDSRGLIRELQKRTGSTPIGFASTVEIDRYRDISSDFLRILGLADVWFISDDSTLLDWCERSHLSLDDANSRIQEIYGVDVRDLHGGPLIGIFERIREGDRYKEWRTQNPERGETIT
jgi:hypothetical protein